MRPRLAVLGLWSLCALALPGGCAWLAPIRIETTVETPQLLPFSRSTAVADSEQVDIQTDVRGQEVRLRVGASQRCLIEQGRSGERFQREVGRTRPWAWAIWLAEVGAAVAVSLSDWSSPGGAAALSLPLTVDAVLLARFPRGERTLPLPPLKVVESVQVRPCDYRTRANVALRIRGERGEILAVTDGGGEALLDPRRWPAPMFPYQVPLATATCPDCPSVPLALSAAAGADLVLGRGGLDDLENWLTLHPDNERAEQVRTARDAQVADLRSEARRHLQAAQLALSQGDLMAAAEAVRACQAVSPRLPTAACDALYRTIVDTFVARQLLEGQAAAARADVTGLEAAAYRCRLMDKGRPACNSLDLLLTQARLAPLKAEIAAHCAAGRFREAQSAAERCESLTPDRGACAELMAQLAEAEAKAERLRATALASAARRAWRKGQRTKACQLARTCWAALPAPEPCRWIARRCKVVP